MESGLGGISYDIGAKSRFLPMIAYVQAIKVFFNFGY
jgi:hypothetical protein